MLYERIAEGMEAIGIFPGDVLMIHSSMKSLGVTDTPAEVLDAINRYLGPRGTLVMPAFSYSTVNQENPFFSYRDTPVCVGLLPETFRHLEGVYRSYSPTHSLSARGYLARELTHDQQLDKTPVGPHSPLRKLPALGGKILMLGCGLHSNTFMHGMEEKMPVPYVFHPEPWHYTMERDDGTTFEMDVMRHGMNRYGKQRYDRAAALMPAEHLRCGKICAADSYVYDTDVLEQVAVAKLNEDPWYFLELHEGVQKFY